MPRTVKKFVVDFWATGLHGEEIGIRQKEQWMAKSRMFTRDMDIYGAIEEEDKKVGIVARRENVWRGRSKKGENELRGRLVVRAFTSEGRWMGSIEEIVTLETMRSLSANDVLPSFVVMVPGYEYLIWVEKARRPFKYGDVMMFTYYDKKTKEFPVYIFKEKVFTLGSDWELLKGGEKKAVASLDGKVLDLGGRIDVKFYDEEAAANEVLTRVTLMFAAMLKYYSDIKDRIKRRVEAVKKGEFTLRAGRGELMLFKNPRRIVA
ncbi:MAG: hypothetical protein ACTSXJ_10440 [Candidatus Baldrarchaeia archaeon]